MQQRRPRLGDIVDDYCPRERRVTNHAVVAIVDDDVKQTRCATCDAEHEYRQAKTPTPRRSKSQAALTHDAGDKPVLAPPRPPVEPEAEADLPLPQVPAVPAVPTVVSPPPAAPAETAMALDGASESAPQDVGDGPDPREDDGPVHRPLIRATFPRPEGQVPERREPEFTVRQPGGRGRGEVDGNRAGYRSNSGRNQRHGQPGGGFGNFGARPHGGGGFGSGGRGPGGGRGDNRQGGGQGQNRGQRPGGGAGRKGGR